MLFPHHQAILPHKLGVLQFISVLIHARSHRLRAQSHKTVLSTPFQMANGSQVVAHHLATDPLLSLMNLLDLFIELKEIFTYVYQILKVHNSETTR